MTDRAHRMIYREIPVTPGCKIGCNDCCGPVPWSANELSQVTMPITAVKIAVGSKTVWMDPATEMCPMLGPKGCTVYDRRPFMCRLFAAADVSRLKCPHGCNALKPLSARKASALTTAYSLQGG